MIELHEVENRMKRAKPDLPIELDFTTRVMEAAGATRIRRDYTVWRTWAAAGVAVIIVAAGGAYAVMHLQASQAANRTAQSQQSKSTSQPKSKNAAYYQQLASSAQSDVDSMSQQTANFADGDYADSQLADSALF